MSRSRALGLLFGVVLDALVPDPRRGHPVAAFGALAGALERRCYADSRARGVAFAVGCVGAPACAGVLLRRSGVVGVAVATWTVLGGRSLRGEALALSDLVARDDLAGARSRVTHLVGRAPSVLDGDGIARAAVESVAENTSDAVVAPLFWGAVAGAPGLLAYRAANTLDAMVGYRSARYARFGWAAARLDDVANLAPSRLTALLVAVAAPVVGGAPTAALRAAMRNASAHPSPNAGWPEAAYAGALGLQLGGRTVYLDRVEDRPRLGAGRVPRPADLPRAARLCAAVTALAAAGAAAWAARR